MRRILLGGLGIALGVFASPAFAQQPHATSQPARGAAFGKPSAVPDPATTAPVESEITPAGLFRNGPSRPTVTQSPGGFGTPTPVITQPPGVRAPTVPTPGMSPTPVTLPGAMPVIQPGMSNPVPPPRPVTGMPPSVTEVRDPTGRIPNGVYVPSVGPEGFECPDPGLDDPMFGNRPRFGLDRLGGMGKTWVSAEVLLWWNHNTQVPALVTTSSPQFNGIVGQGDTRVLLGGSFGETYHVGGRIGFGHWFGGNECRGVDGRFFWVSPSSTTFVASVPPLGLLARPFINVNPTAMAAGIGLGQSAEVVAGPGVAVGNVIATMKSTVWGGDLNYRRYLFGNGCSRVDALVGFRYLDLREELTIAETFVRTADSNPTVGIPANSGIITDRFRTENQFYGGQIGLAASMQRGRWSLDYRGTIALGTVSQSAEISGAQVLAFPNGGIMAVPGGLLAVPGTNIGRFEQNRFAVLPEIGLNVGYQVTSRLKVFVGYNILYLSSAVRPGEVIDTRIDAARVPNLIAPGTGAVPVALRPLPQLSTSGYYIQGINFGLTYRW